MGVCGLPLFDLRPFNPLIWAQNTNPPFFGDTLYIHDTAQRIATERIVLDVRVGNVYKNVSLESEILCLMTLKRQVVSNWFDMDNTQYCFNIGGEGVGGEIKCVMWSSHCMFLSPNMNMNTAHQPIVICRVKFPRVRVSGCSWGAG